MDPSTVVPAQALPASQLCRGCDASSFAFETTAELEPLVVVIGQERAVDALRFGIGIQRSGYHIFAHGPVGSGKTTTIRQFLAREAARRDAPRDWCYVYNFEEPHRPRAVRLPAGGGSELRQTMNQLIDELLVALPTTLENEATIARRKRLLGDFERRSQENFEQVKQAAAQAGVALLQGPDGVGVAPLAEDGTAMKHETFDALPDADKMRIREQLEAAQGLLDAAARSERVIQREATEAIVAFDRSVAAQEVSIRLVELRERYAALPFVLTYFDAVERDVQDHLDFFGPAGDEDEDAQNSAAHQGDPLAAARARRRTDPRLRRYSVNVIVDHSQDQTAPVITERYPTLANLVGRMDHEQRMGALVTDFTLIKPGALHRANDGFLVIDAEDLLNQPNSWDALKRALRHEEIRLEVPGSEHSTQTTITLDPEPIALHCKVVLIGSTRLFFGLHALDSDVPELFKVGAEFAASMPRTADNEALYARFIGTVARNEQLLPFEAGAVARIVEHSSRLSEDTQRLSTYFMDITDLLREADYWAHQAKRVVVRCVDVDEAIGARVRRSDLSRQRMLEAFDRDIMLLDVRGSAIGQVNGLTVLTRGDFSFGMPSRITARVRLGAGDVVAIEREVDLSGPFHSKGVLILQGFLSGRYVPNAELPIAASLTFEQSYSAVEGDSASSPELYALLSCLAELPIKQSLAVTGSVNQAGEIQAIGGVNDKIEGFFDVCRQQGLSGDQGVLIPASNVQHLMLRRDVVEAVDAGRFHIYPVSHVDQGIALLTGVEAGQPGSDGRFPTGSVNGRVQARLERMAEQRRRNTIGEPSA
ncbi:MAG: AAA family ATPase [Chloroflexi bacterium]|nr:AAA family ATPase [Chloroflexota bacterium]